MPEVQKVSKVQGDCEAARIKLGLTEDEVKAIQRAADATYQNISYDLEPTNKRSKTISREELIEVVLDANYMDNFGFSKYNPKTEGIKRALEISRDYEALKALLRAHFTYERYEVGH